MMSGDNGNRCSRRRCSSNWLVSQTDLISSSSSYIRSVTNDRGKDIAPTADSYSDKKKKNRKENFATASFRSLGCIASSQVSVPDSIRSSANWEGKKVGKRNQRRNNLTNVDDIWCLPAVALSTTADTADSFDRVKVDVEKKKKKKKKKKKIMKMNLRDEQSSASAQRMMNQETVIFQTSRYGFGMTDHNGMDQFRHRSFHHHVRRSPSQEELSEIVMLQNRRLNVSRIGSLDQYEEWRLNIDNMSYEDLLELGEKIGYVNTGLKEEEIMNCLRKMKFSSAEGQEEDLLTQSNQNCSICQEEYGEEEETGKLECGHVFHSHCIEQWLVRKNICPICKTAAISE